ncbi:hypothetical protein D7Z54_32470 [Salibacterium salarium]|uniref:Uncharacterized protein n=1 Tax=Salibacterium salarium TaxID=284579 RepID=A0A3R9P376_9BACI|nr:hypothetical protein D7Z54_32470 [Salibacterium salarium]
MPTESEPAQGSPSFYSKNVINKQRLSILYTFSATSKSNKELLLKSHTSVEDLLLKARTSCAQRRSHHILWKST